MSGERRAVIAAVVLGEDEGLSPGLRDQFRASGLYHLLAVSGQNVAYVVAGMLAQRWGTTVRDTDRDIEATEGRQISEIFVDDGEEYFRALERAARELTALTGL